MAGIPTLQASAGDFWCVQNLRKPAKIADEAMGLGEGEDGIGDAPLIVSSRFSRFASSVCIRSSISAAANAARRSASEGNSTVTLLLHPWVLGETTTRPQKR